VHDPHMSVLAEICRLVEEERVTRLPDWSPIVCIAASAAICTGQLEVVERLYSGDHHCPQAPARTGWRSDCEYFCNISHDHGSFGACRLNTQALMITWLLNGYQQVLAFGMSTPTVHRLLKATDSAARRVVNLWQLSIAHRSLRAGGQTIRLLVINPTPREDGKHRIFGGQHLATLHSLFRGDRQGRGL
jgi:hypothetical protein